MYLIKHNAHAQKTHATSHLGNGHRTIKKNRETKGFNRQPVTLAKGDPGGCCHRGCAFSTLLTFGNMSEPVQHLAHVCDMNKQAKELAIKGRRDIPQHDHSKNCCTNNRTNTRHKHSKGGLCPCAAMSLLYYMSHSGSAWCALSTQALANNNSNTPT